MICNSLGDDADFPDISSPHVAQHALEIVNKIVNKQCLCLCLPVSADLTINHLKSTFRQITSDYMTSTSASNICGVTAISSSSFPQKAGKIRNLSFLAFGDKTWGEVGNKYYYAHNGSTQLCENCIHCATPFTCFLVLPKVCFFFKYSRNTTQILKLPRPP